MKVLFISSGRSGRVGDVVRNQGESLKAIGIEIDYFLINPGFWGYMKAINKLRTKIEKGKYDLSHAHYSLSGFIGALAGCKPLIVSLMGSDVLTSPLQRIFIRYFYRFRWDKTIVKTSQMKEMLRISNAYVIPNGVNLSIFKPILKQEARKYLNYPQEKLIIMFISGPERSEKNPELARAAIKALNNDCIEFKHIYEVPNTEIPYYLNSADTLLVASKWEGSANIIKEAMACNCPVVSTNVGDVNWLFGTTTGYYLTGFLPEEIAYNLNLALNYSKNVGRTKGRERIIALNLDSSKVAQKMIDVYRESLL